MVISFLQTLPPIPSLSQPYGCNNNESVDTENEKSCSIPQQQQPKKEQPSTTTTTITATVELQNNTASSDPFVRADEMWSSSFNNNVTDCSAMIQSIRGILSFLVDIKQHSDNTVHALGTSNSSQHTQQSIASSIPSPPFCHDKNTSSALVNKSRRKLQTASLTKDIIPSNRNASKWAENDSRLSLPTTKNNDLLINHKEDPYGSSSMTYPLSQEHSSKITFPDSNSEPRKWLWSFLSSSSNKTEAIENKVEASSHYHGQEQQQQFNSAQQKQPLWTLTHSYVRDNRINSSELRMISAELNMIRNSKITRPLRNRRYQEKREDDFVWGRRSFLRIVHGVGELE